MNDCYNKATYNKYVIVYYNIRPYIIRWADEEESQALTLSHSALTDRHGLLLTPSCHPSAGYPLPQAGTLLSQETLQGPHHLGIPPLGRLGSVGVKTKQQPLIFKERRLEKGGREEG